MNIKKTIPNLWNRYFILFLASVAAFFIFMFAFQNNPILYQGKYHGFEVGTIAERDLYADRDITYIDEDATQVRKEAKTGLVLPVFVIQQDITRNVLERFEIFSAVFSDNFLESKNAETIFLEIQAVLPETFSREEIAMIFEAERIGEVLPIAGEVLASAMEEGIAAIPANLPGEELARIEIWSWDEGLQSVRTGNIGTVLTLSTLSGWTKTLFENRDLSGNILEAVSTVIGSLAEENLFYDAEITDESRRKAENDVEPIYRTLTKNERLIKRGYAVTTEEMTKIEALNRVSGRESLYAVFSSVVIIAVMYLLSLLFFTSPMMNTPLDIEKHLLLLGIGLVYLILIALVLRFLRIPESMPFTAFLPTALASMLITILINARSAVLFSLIISIPAVLFSAGSPVPFLFSFLSGVAAAFVIRRTTRRIDLVLANFILAGFSALLLASLGFLQDYSVVTFFIAFGWGALNGFTCGIVNIGILPLLEHWLNAPTRFRLMELSDINAPMLKKMLTLAPGTYSHSLNVANLAEAACREIDANPVLARVGAYYHDIGKIDQPEYFIENQTGDNKHDELKPSLSVAVIKSHVKLGIEKGKELGLPKKVLDIIAQHHGSGLISYFYSEALKDTKESAKVDPEDFSYNESPPSSKEAAVVLLADSVEATTRTLKKPTIAKLEKTIWGIIQDKFRNQQLNSSSLTLHDLDTIKNSFVHILAGNFHSRIEYPDMNGEGK